MPPRLPGRMTFLTVASLAAAACLPQLPTLPEAKDPSDPRIRLSTPVVWVSDPKDKGTMKRSDLYSSVGAPVRFDGVFTPGTELHLMAARIQTPDLGFHILRIPVADTVSPGPAYVQGSPAILVNTYQIRLKLRLRDADGSVISIDSVDVNLR